MPNPSSEVVQFLILDEQASPGYFANEGWAAIRKDPELQELIHGALAFITRFYRGSDPESIKMADSFLAGVAFTALARRQTDTAALQDRQIFTPEDV